MATYRATNLTVVPREPSFTTDKDVLLDIECDFERKSAGGFDPTILWAGDIYLNSVSKANLLDSQKFTRSPFNPLDMNHYSKTINLGRRPSGTFTGNIIVAAHDIL